MFLFRFWMLNHDVRQLNLLDLVNQVVILVDVKGGDGGPGINIDFDSEVRVVGAHESCKLGQCLQSQDRVLREEVTFSPSDVASI